MLICLIGITLGGCSNWNQPTEKLIDINERTTQQLANEGEILIFGGVGKSRKAGNVGKAQCPVCHTFNPGQPSKRAPNLWGIATRQRIKSTPIAYLAESHVCPSCYVTAGWGLKGSQGCESPMPKVHLPPINLTLKELVAIDTWIYTHEGEIPPTPQHMTIAYKNILSKEEWRYVTRDSQNRYDAETSVQQLFFQHACAGCHIIPGIPAATGKLGPPLYLKKIASARLKDPTYRGNASSPSEYIAESILYHDAYVVSEKAIYAHNTLPSSHYQNKIKPSDLKHMVEFLENVEQGTQYQPVDETANERCLNNRKS